MTKPITSAQFKAAFGVQLNRYESPLPSRSRSIRSKARTGEPTASPGQIHRGFDGPIQIPANLSGIMVALVGLDNCSRGGPCDGNPSGFQALTPPEVATLYKISAVLQHLPLGLTDVKKYVLFIGQVWFVELE
jgi:hypothetical protein